MASNQAPSKPLAPSDTVIPLGSSVYIKWKATDDQALPAGALSLFSTTDDLTFIPLASGLSNSSNGGCVVDDPSTAADDGATGCFVWENGSPSNSAFRIRLIVTDANGISSSFLSLPLNPGSFSILAGNTDTGVGASASAAVLQYDKALANTEAQVGSLAVARNGTVYFLDSKFGVMRIDPAVGTYEIFLRTTGTSTGDGGNLSLATARQPLRIALDAQDKLLVFDYDRIRRIDTTLATPTIQTLIGGGGSVSDGIAATALAIASPGATSNNRRAPFFALPNGDIYFQFEFGSSSLGGKVRVYKQATETVHIIVPGGIGFHSSASQDIGECVFRSFGVTYNPATSALTNVHALFQLLSSQPQCYSTTPNAASWASLDTTTFASRGQSVAPPNGPSTNPSFEFASQARTGELYTVSRDASRIYRYLPSSNTREVVAGSGVNGQCNDGTLATACDMDPLDAFISEQGQVYILDKNRIRTIDATGSIRTLYGQSLSFGDGADALTSRMNLVNSVKHWNDGSVDKFVILDKEERRFREFTQSGIISHVAGNGSSVTPNTSTSAAAQPISSYLTNRDYDFFAVESATGNVVFNRGAGYIARLIRATDRWSHIAGGGATSYVSADGLAGNALALAGYAPSVIGYNGTSLLALLASGPSPGVNSYLKSFLASNGTQSHVAGVSGAAGSNFCTANGTVETSACAVPAFPLQHSDASFDPFDNRWIVMKRSTNKILALNTGAGTTGTKVTTLLSLPRNATSFSYRRDAALTTNIVYYCGTDGVMYKYDLNATPNETILGFPNSTFVCDGYSLSYIPSRNSLLFPFKNNGLYGIAEYLSP
ncbi:MAG: hypothetical protein IOD12_09120 [Silvanigrellales bacterium]|nr:hypothetical protein [Silvanigrellales bacterium]